MKLACQSTVAPQEPGWDPLGQLCAYPSAVTKELVWPPTYVQPDKAGATTQPKATWHRCGGGESGGGDDGQARTPQSVQSVPRSQQATPPQEYWLPGPPSSQPPSEAYWQVSEQRAQAGGDGGVGAGVGGKQAARQTTQVYQQSVSTVQPGLLFGCDPSVTGRASVHWCGAVAQHGPPPPYRSPPSSVHPAKMAA